MSLFKRLRVRLFLSYLAVILTGAFAVTITLSILAPSAFDHRMMRGAGSGAGSGMGMGMRMGADTHEAFVDALRTSLPVAVVISVIVAAAVAAFVGRQIVRPIDDVRRVAARMTDGHYDERIPEPAELELAALARDINTLATSLQHTEKRRGELIGEVAHEMRTPLTSIEGYVEGILDGVFEPTEEVLTAIGEETTRLRRLATDLASLSRADEGALELRMQNEDLAALTHQVADRLMPQFESKGVHVSVETESPLSVRCDASRIVQVITNLMGNALTYTDAGGNVTLRASHRGTQAVVSVTDTGVGLAPEDVKHVFERFYRVPGVARPAGGSGIGLTIARSLARAHGGDVQASSPGVGHGATFELVLPL